MRYPRPFLIQAAQNAIGEHLPLKIPPVQLLAQYRLIQLLQLGQRELPRQKIIADRLMVQLHPQRRQRRLKDMVMVQYHRPPVLQVVPAAGLGEHVRTWIYL